MTVFEPSDHTVRPGHIAPQKTPDSPPAKKPEVGKDGICKQPRDGLKGATKTTDEQAFKIPVAPEAPTPMKTIIKKDAKVITDQVVKAKAGEIFRKDTLVNIKAIDEKATQKQLAAASKEYREERGLSDLGEEQVLEKDHEEKKDKVRHEHSKENHLSILLPKDEKKEINKSKEEGKVLSFSKASEIDFIEETAIKEAAEEKDERQRLDNALEEEKEAVESDRNRRDERIEKSKS